MMTDDQMMKLRAVLDAEKLAFAGEKNDTMNVNPHNLVHELLERALITSREALELRDRAKEMESDANKRETEAVNRWNEFYKAFMQLGDDLPSLRASDAYVTVRKETRG